MLTRKDVEDIIEKVSDKIINALNLRCEGLEKKMDDARIIQTKALERIGKLETGHAELVVDIASLQDGNAKMEAAMSKNMDVLKKDISELKNKVQELENKKDTDNVLNVNGKEKTASEGKSNEEDERWKRECALIRQYSRRENLEIHNVPVVENEDLRKIAAKVLQLIDNSIKEDDINVAHRLKKRKKENVPGIIVRMKDREKKFDVLKKKKEKEKVITQDDVLGNGNGDLIFVNDNIDPYFLNLFLFTRKVAKKNNWKYVWFTNGNIFVKKDEKSSKIRIRDEEELRRRFNVEGSGEEIVDNTNLSESN